VCILFVVCCCFVSTVCHESRHAAVELVDDVSCMHVRLVTHYEYLFHIIIGFICGYINLMKYHAAYSNSEYQNISEC